MRGNEVLLHRRVDVSESLFIEHLHKRRRGVVGACLSQTDEAPHRVPDGLPSGVYVNGDTGEWEIPA
jgi:hypothetical protein